MKKTVDFAFGQMSVSYERIKENNMSYCHRHSSYELYLLLEGERYLFAENTFYSAKAGDLFLIPPDVDHRTIDAGGGAYARITVNIPHELMPCEVKINAPVLFTRPIGSSAEKLKEYGEELVRRMSDGGAGQGAGLLSVTAGMIHLLLTEAPSTAEKADSPAVGRMTELLGYIDTHYTEPLSLVSLASRFYLSEFHLCRLFRQYTGRSIMSYVSALRIRRAKELLVSTDETVKSIATLCGFGSVAAFGRSFVSQVGMSACKYRRSSRQ